MFEISITTRFSAAHHLAGYKGPCANVHGHNWEVTVFVRGKSLDKLGMLVDFGVLKQSVNKVINELDHADLNTIPAFRRTNPTSENIAKYIHDRLAQKLKTGKRAIAKVVVAETPGNAVAYWDEKQDD